MTLSTLVPPCQPRLSEGSRENKTGKAKNKTRASLGSGGYFRISELTQQHGRGKKTRQTSCDKRDNNFV